MSSVAGIVGGAVAIAGAIPTGGASLGLMAGLQMAGGVAMVAGSVTGNKKLTMLGGIAAGAGALGSSGFFGEGVANWGKAADTVGKAGSAAGTASGAAADAMAAEKGVMDAVNVADTGNMLNAATPGTNALNQSVAKELAMGGNPSSMTDGLINTGVKNAAANTGNAAGGVLDTAKNSAGGAWDKIKRLDSGTKMMLGQSVQGVAGYFGETEKAQMEAEMRTALQNGNIAEANRLRQLYNQSLAAQPVTSAINPNAPNPYAVPPVNVSTVTATPTPGLINMPRVA